MRDLLLSRSVLRRSVAGPLVLVALALISLTYLQQHRPDPTPTPPAIGVKASPTWTWSASPPPETPTATSGSTTAASTALDHDFTADVEPVGNPVDSTSAAIARDQAEADLFTRARAAARSFLTNFARPGPSITPEQWWAAVAAHLSAAGRQAYTGTDPQLVPYTRITGPVVILPTTDPEHTLIARARTDAGYYRVQMTAVAGQLWVETVSSETSLTGESTRR